MQALAWLPAARRIRVFLSSGDNSTEQIGNGMLSKRVIVVESIIYRNFSHGCPIKKNHNALRGTHKPLQRTLVGDAYWHQQAYYDEQHSRYQDDVVYTPVRDKFIMQIVLTALIFLHIPAVPLAYSHKSNTP